LNVSENLQLIVITRLLIEIGPPQGWNNGMVQSWNIEIWAKNTVKFLTLFFVPEKKILLRQKVWRKKGYKYGNNK